MYFAFPAQPTFVTEDDKVIYVQSELFRTERVDTIQRIQRVHSFGSVILDFIRKP